MPQANLAFRQGYDAARAGASIYSNPHKFHSKAFYAWEDGWAIARLTAI